jgi:hypothetical protein
LNHPSTETTNIFKELLFLLLTTEESESINLQVKFLHFPKNLSYFQEVLWEVAVYFQKFFGKKLFLQKF